MLPIDLLLGLGAFIIKAFMHRGHQRDLMIANNRRDNHNEKESARNLKTREAYSARRFAFSFATVILFGSPIIAPLIGVPIVVSFFVWDPGFLFFEGSNEVFIMDFGNPEQAEIVIPAPLYSFYFTMVGFYYGTERDPRYA